MDQSKPQQQTIYHNGVQQQQHQSTSSNKGARKIPYVKITEQPASKALRFRYECEGRSAGSIPGVNSTSENKTFPTIEIVGYKGPAIVIVSCVTKDLPHRPHPHNLVGKEGCRKGVCKMEINSDAMRAVFSNLGIQCVKKKDIDAALKTRQELRVDPFLEGFEHRLQPSSIDLNSVRLCFQVFIEEEKTGRCRLPLAPVVSDPIFDKKAMSDLVICRLSSCSSTVLGNTQIILLCEKVVKEDISVRFFEESDGQVVWEGYGEFQHSDVHKQTAITFKTPRYHNIDITEPVKVLIQLKRPSDGLTSEALPFEYIPLDSDPAQLKRKRQKRNGDPIHILLQEHQTQDHKDGHQRQLNVTCWNTVNVAAVKTEPRDASPQPCTLYQMPTELRTSPPQQPLSYNVGSPVLPATQSNQHMTSASPHYNIPNPMNAFAQTTQTQQQHQQYNNNIMLAGPTHWESTNPVSVVDAKSTFATHNLTTTGNAVGVTVNGTGAVWNTTSNHFLSTNHPQYHLQQQHPQLQQQLPQQQHYHQQQQANDNVATSNNGAVGNANPNNSEHGLSNLLNFDSEQLVHINTEEEKMMRLNCENFFSNLSISQ